MPSQRQLELLAPAGGFEQLRAAVHFGADAVYLGGRRWGMRSRADNFDDVELSEAIEYAHAHGVRVHLTLNTLMFDDDLDELPSYLHHVAAAGVDAVIVADLGALTRVRQHAPNVEVHVSTQASVTNAEAALAYARLGASRIVLAREMRLSQIARLHERIGNDIELEAFVHGAMCMAVSGRCLMSAVMVGAERSAARGACTQPCRWTWTLHEELRPGQDYGLESDERGSYLLSANDLCMIEHLDRLAAAGVRSLKIEGRNKGAYYVAATTNAYRHVIDGDDPSVWVHELDAVSHRPYSTGFYFGNPTQNPGRVDYAQERTLVAVVDSCHTSAGRSHAEVICRNRADVGTQLTVIAPRQEIRTFMLDEAQQWDHDTERWVCTSGMRQNMARYRIPTPYSLQPGDMLCVTA